MDVGDHELLQVRTLICDTDELRHNFYVLNLCLKLLAGISPLPVEEPHVFMVSLRIDNRWDFTKSLYVCKFQVNMVLC